MKNIKNKTTLKIVALIIMAGSCSNAFSQVKVYETKGDKSKLFTQLGDASITTNTSGADVTLDPATTYQSIDGFGFTVTQGSAEAIRTLSAADQTTLLKELFDPVNGNGVSIARIGLGATDLSRSCYTYAENGDISLSNFSLNGPDMTDLIPVLKQIKAINPNVKILATPWTAPRWMKSNNEWVGGYLKNHLYDAYANYFMKYLQAMKAQGLDIWGISIQNEPGNEVNGPSMYMSANDQKTFINSYFGPKLRASEFSDVKIIAYDHNCDNTDFPIDLLKNSTYTDGAAFHLYAGNISAMTTVHDAVPNKKVWFTEQYTAPTTDFVGDLIWHSKNITIGSMNNWSSSALEWNLASYPNWEPYTHVGAACHDCQGALTIDQGKIITRKLSYYIISHFSKFVQPNAKRIKMTGGKANLYAVAFKNPDGSGALITQSDGSWANGYWGTLKINIGNGKATSVWIDGGALQTFSFPIGTFDSYITSDNSLNTDADKIMIFPNPVKDQLTLNTGDLKAESISISDIQGRIVYSNGNSFSGSYSLNLSHLESGMYILNFKVNKATVTKKLIIE